MTYDLKLLTDEELCLDLERIIRELLARNYDIGCVEYLFTGEVSLYSMRRCIDVEGKA